MNLREVPDGWFQIFHGPLVCVSKTKIKTVLTMIDPSINSNAFDIWHDDFNCKYSINYLFLYIHTINSFSFQNVPLQYTYHVLYGYFWVAFRWQHCFLQQKYLRFFKEQETIWDISNYRFTPEWPRHASFKMHALKPTSKFTWIFLIIFLILSAVGY